MLPSFVQLTLVPHSYNSCVLAVVEAFYRLTRQLRETEKAVAELHNLREMELEQFRSMTEEWMEKGEAYAAEIKRLELALAKESKDGVACVAVMRHGSLVDRAGSKRFQARLKRISNSQDEEGMLTLSISRARVVGAM
jgi:glutamate/tyrosine decarboxylase-like PLP-dependent enzyme